MTGTSRPVKEHTLWHKSASVLDTGQSRWAAGYAECQCGKRFIAWTVQDAWQAHREHKAAVLAGRERALAAAERIATDQKELLDRLGEGAGQ